jgi:hypothetical protein
MDEEQVRKILAESLRNLAFAFDANESEVEALDAEADRLSPAEPELPPKPDEAELLRRHGKVLTGECRIPLVGEFYWSKHRCVLKCTSSTETTRTECSVAYFGGRRWIVTDTPPVVVFVPDKEGEFWALPRGQMYRDVPGRSDGYRRREIPAATWARIADQLEVDDD